MEIPPQNSWLKWAGIICLWTIAPVCFFPTRMLFQPSSLTPQQHFSCLVSPFRFTPLHISSPEKWLTNTVWQTCMRQSLGHRGHEVLTPHVVRSSLRVGGGRAARKFSEYPPFITQCHISLAVLTIVLENNCFIPKAGPKLPKDRDYTLIFASLSVLSQDHWTQ